MGIPVLPPCEDGIHTDSDSYNEDEEDDEGVEELEDQLRVRARSPAREKEHLSLTRPSRGPSAASWAHY